MFGSVANVVSAALAYSGHVEPMRFDTNELVSLTVNANIFAQGAWEANGNWGLHDCERNRKD